MDNSAPELLAQGLSRLGFTSQPIAGEAPTGRALHLPLEAHGRLLAYATELLKWNEKVSLTAITQTTEVVDKHLLDSLAVAWEVRGATHLLDLGAGAGLPGIPLAIALPTLRATLVDAVAKKVAFMKSGAVKGGVADRVKALHVRAEGHPEKEGLPLVDLVISRAFMDVGAFLPLARAYLAPGGRVVTMLGQTPSAEALERLAEAAGMSLQSRRTFQLPGSGDPRGVAVFHVKQT